MVRHGIYQKRACEKMMREYTSKSRQNCSPDSGGLVGALDRALGEIDRKNIALRQAQNELSDEQLLNADLSARLAQQEARIAELERTLSAALDALDRREGEVKFAWKRIGELRKQLRQKLREDFGLYG